MGSAVHSHRPARRPLRRPLPLALLPLAALPLALLPLAALLLPGPLLAGSRPAAGNVEVRSIRHWTAPDHTRIVIDCSAAPSFDHHTREAPARIVIDLEHAAFAPGVAAVGVGDGVVERVRINTLRRRRVAQVVLDLSARQAYHVFTLPPSHGRPHRLVVDVERPESAAHAARRQHEIDRLKQQRTIIVMVDPGHGGEDPGALGAGALREKDVCLGVARALRDAINRQPGFRAFLTRDGDYYVSLGRRTELARQHGADCFVSIHVNASRNRKVHGTEVYFLSLRGASDASAKQVAQRENAADRIGGVPTEARGDVAGILMDLMQTSTLERSSHLANTVVAHLQETSGLADRGVKQAGFLVLKTAGVPAILVETAFISHRRDAQRLRSAKFQRRLGQLLAAGVVDYARRDAAVSVRPGD